MKTEIDITEIPRLRAVLESCKAQREALEAFKNASATHRRAKAYTPKLDAMLAQLQSLRADEAATKRAIAKTGSKVAASTAGSVLEAALGATPEEARRLNRKAADHREGAGIRARLRTAYAAASPRQKSLIWNTFRRALTAYPSEK